MNCRDIDDMIIPHFLERPIPQEAAVHIAECQRCSRLAKAILQSPQVDEIPQQQLTRIGDAILHDLKPVKPLPTAGVLQLAQLFILASVVVIGVLIFGRAGWHALNPVQKVAVFGGLTASVTLLTCSAVRQMVPGSRLHISPYLLVTAALGGMAGIFSLLFIPHREAMFGRGLVCLKIGLECAITAAALLWLVLRRGVVLRPVLTGATAGTLAGLSGLTVLEIFCPNLNKYHILVWHIGALSASVIGGIAIGLLAERSGWKGIRAESLSRPHTT
jgi:hypothetical protein